MRVPRRLPLVDKLLRCGHVPHACVALAVVLIALGVLGVGPERIRADRVVNVPTVMSQCPRAASWEKLKACLQRFGAAKIERTEGVVRLVHVSGSTSGWPEPGYYLYAQKGSALQIVGAWRYASNASVEVLSFAPLKVKSRSGYRLDIGTSEPTTVSFDGETVVSATMQSKSAVFCMGPSYSCEPTIESCDVFVDGKAYYTFRGTLKIEGGMVTVTGDRSRAGVCSPPERVPLAFDILDQ